MGEFELEKAKISSLKEGLAILYKTKQFSDVVYEKDGEHFKAHKLIMTAASSEFEKLQKFLKPGETILIKEESVSKSGFTSLLHYIYNDTIENQGELCIIETYYAASFFKVQALVDKCLKEMEAWVLTNEKVYKLLAKGANIPFFINKCLEFIKNNPVNFLYAYNFETCCLETLKILLESRALDGIPPMELVERVMAWCQNYLNLQENDDFSSARHLLLTHISAIRTKQLLALLHFEKLDALQLAVDIPSRYPKLLKSEEIIMFTTYQNNHSLPHWCMDIASV